MQFVIEGRSLSRARMGWTIFNYKMTTERVCGKFAWIARNVGVMQRPSKIRSNSTMAGALRAIQRPSPHLLQRFPFSEVQITARRWLDVVFIWLRTRVSVDNADNVCSMWGILFAFICNCVWYVRAYANCEHTFTCVASYRWMPWKASLLHSCWDDVLCESCL